MQKNNFIYRPHRFLKPVRSLCLLFTLISPFASFAQNTLSKEILADQIKTVAISGNQIFNITVGTTDENKISLSSTLDGEYQNKYQIATEEKDNTLTLRLEFMSFEDIPDDKRNAHKVIAATLYLKIPKNLNLNIVSDVGSVDVSGNYNSLSVELLQGHCVVDGLTKSATINTIDGNISVVTRDAKINASSNNGEVVVDDFSRSQSQWNLKSINGDITVAKKE
ncbi:hypothetical protein [Winogradskyella sp.]|uniref:hypothetical protein n=1 Tax=Winogradskyella sp. TaxID=1883156 RepID=UPI0035169FAB